MWAREGLTKTSTEKFTFLIINRPFYDKILDKARLVLYNGNVRDTYTVAAAPFFFGRSLLCSFQFYGKELVPMIISCAPCGWQWLHTKRSLRSVCLSSQSFVSSETGDKKAQKEITASLLNKAIIS